MLDLLVSGGIAVMPAGTRPADISASPAARSPPSARRAACNRSVRRGSSMPAIRS